MSIDKNTINYYKKKRAGKGSAGILLDTILFDIIIFGAVFFIILRTTKIFILTLILACAITLAIDYFARCYKSKRLEKYVIKEITALRHELLIEKLIFRTSRERRKVILNAASKENGTIFTSTKDPYVFLADGEKIFVDMIVAIPPKKATIDNIIPAIEYMNNKRLNRAILACTTSFDESAKSLIAKTGLNIELMEQSSLLESAMDLNIIVLDSELKKSLEEKINSTRITRKAFITTAANIKNVKRFGIFGAFLFLMASFTPFRTYYYSVAVICFILSILIYMYNTKQENKDSAEV